MRITDSKSESMVLSQNTVDGPLRLRDEWLPQVGKEEEEKGTGLDVR